ncbi:MRS6 [Sanghuangporus sanghuang]
MDSHFQVIILGTGLAESIAAAALAKVGLKVAHIDTNPYYGADEASLTTKELQECLNRATERLDQISRLRTASVRGEFPSASRDYSLSLSPSVIPARGPLISSLIGSGVARYGGFKLLESVSVYSSDGLKSVPGSKEEIFRSKDLSLIDKRKLMRFLMFASGEFESSSELRGKETMDFGSFLKEVFSLDTQLASVLACALALCKSQCDTALPALGRIRRYLRSAGRYGASPFLVGQYGGLGELAQGFCRVCAVSGGTYILGRDILAFESKSESSSGSEETKNLRLKLSEIPEDLTADVVISSINYLPHLSNFPQTETEVNLSTTESHSCCIALVDGVIPRLSSYESAQATENDSTGEPVEGSSEEIPSRPVDAALLVFPSGSLSSGKASGPVNVLINGEGTSSCPRGKSLLYLSTTTQNIDANEANNPEQILRPYLEITLSLLQSPSGEPLRELSSAFYIKSSPTLSDTHLASLKGKGIFVSPPLPEHIAEAGDAAASIGETLFRDVLKQLGNPDADDVELWPPLPPGLDDDDDMI